MLAIFTATADAISSPDLLIFSVPAPSVLPIFKLPESASREPAFVLLPRIVNVPPVRSTFPDQVSFVPSITTPFEPVAVEVELISSSEPEATVNAVAESILELPKRSNFELLLIVKVFAEVDTKSAALLDAPLPITRVELLVKSTALCFVVSVVSYLI